MGDGGSAMSNLIIRDGKFYRGNVEVKPEFGNREQINALKEALRKANESKVEAKLIQEETIAYYASVRFTCPICEKYNEVYVLEDDPSEYCIDASDVEHCNISCTNLKCNTEFTIESDKTKKGNMSIVLTYDQDN